MFLRSQSITILLPRSKYQVLKKTEDWKRKPKKETSHRVHLLFLGKNGVHLLCVKTYIMYENIVRGSM